MSWYRKTKGAERKHWNRAWKYITTKTVARQTSFRNLEFHSAYKTLASDGVLTINEGFAWDGPSGPTIDTESFMLGSAVHDAQYQILMREVRRVDFNAVRFAELEIYRAFSDNDLREICVSEGMFKIRSWWVWLAVRWFGSPAIGL